MRLAVEPEREAMTRFVQELWLNRWLAKRIPKGIRRATDREGVHPLKHFRQCARLSAEGLAFASGVPARTLENCERGQGLENEFRWPAIAAVLKVQPLQILEARQPVVRQWRTDHRGVKFKVNKGARA